MRGDGQAHVVDDGAGHGIGLGRETRASHLRRRAAGGAGGDVEHQGNARDQGEQQEPVPATALPLPLPGEGLLQAAKSFMMSILKRAPQEAPTIQEGC